MQNITAKPTIVKLQPMVSQRDLMEKQENQIQHPKLRELQTLINKNICLSMKDVYSNEDKKNLKEQEAKINQLKLELCLA